MSVDTVIYWLEHVWLFCDVFWSVCRSIILLAEVGVAIYSVVFRYQKHFNEEASYLHPSYRFG